jgi:paraquat-inducible protein A
MGTTAHSDAADVTAAQAMLVGCPVCHLVCRQPGARDLRQTVQCRCPRCGAALHGRIPKSLMRTWALLIAAFICYFPANILPVTVTSGAWYLALIIFVASILIPLLKLLVLTFLMVSIHTHAAWRLEERTRLYRLIAVVGRWSMLDIFVVTMLVALVHLQSLASIEAGPGAIFFGAVVVITMLATQSFDPRLIWDAARRSQ